jgi:hypothetical protein
VNAAELRRDELQKCVTEKEQQTHNLQAQNIALLDQVQLMGAKQQSLDTSANTSLNLSRYN